MTKYEIKSTETKVGARVKLVADEENIALFLGKKAWDLAELVKFILDNAKNLNDTSKVYGIQGVLGPFIEK